MHFGDQGKIITADQVISVIAVRAPTEAGASWHWVMSSINKMERLDPVPGCAQQSKSNNTNTHSKGQTQEYSSGHVGCRFRMSGSHARIETWDHQNFSHTKTGNQSLLKSPDFFFFYCSGFCHTLKWNSHGFTCVPHPDPPSHLPLYPIPLGLPSAPGPSACLMHPTWAGDQFHPR